METIVATAIATGSAASVGTELCAKLEASLGGKVPAFALVFASTAQPLGELMPIVATAFPDTVLLASSTAGEFTEGGDVKSSVSIVAVAGDFRAFASVATGLKANVEGAVDAAAKGLPKAVEGFPHQTAIVLIDPLSGKGEEATLLLAARLGPEARLAGGAAGDDLKMTHTEIAVGRKVVSDAIAVAVVFSKQPLGVGVCHGHSPLSDPLKVTRAEGNVVHEVDGRPAWDVWAERTKTSAAKRGVDPALLADDAVGGYLLRYEAGLPSGDGIKVRAPLTRATDGSISFACGIPQGAVFRITESEPEAQVQSAREAARRAKSQLDGPCAGAIVFDCICRKLILDDRFSVAVKSIADELGNVPLAGFETYGEIALDAGDMSGFHNTTTVVLALPRGVP